MAIFNNMHVLRKNKYLINIISGRTLTSECDFLKHFRFILAIVKTKSILHYIIVQFSSIVEQNQIQAMSVISLTLCMLLHRRHLYSAFALNVFLCNINDRWSSF